MLSKLLRLLIGQRIVTERIARGAESTLAEILIEKGFSDTTLLPEPVVRILVQEAGRRAAASRADGFARAGDFYDELARSAEAVIAVFNGAADADSRVRAILEFHGVVGPKK